MVLHPILNVGTASLYVKRCSNAAAPVVDWHVIILVLGA